MLKEYRKVRQHTGEPNKRWFANNYFDLIIWESKPNVIQIFHLCYEKHKNEKVLTWSSQNGFKHFGIDDGETIEREYKMTPILVDDNGVPNIKILIDKFTQSTGDIEEKISNFIIKKLSDYENSDARSIINDQ